MRVSPALALFAVALLVLGASFVRQAGPPADELQASSVGALSTTTTSTPASPQANAEGPRNEPTPGSGNASAADAKKDPETAPPANDSASDATKDAPPDAAPEAALPAFASKNETVTWNATMGGGAAACVPAFGLPVCAPDPQSTGDTARSKALGSAGVDVVGGALTVTWSTQNGFSGVRAQLVAGTGCDGDVCESTRDLNLSASSSGSPLRLNVTAIDLASNETLLLVLTEQCDNSLGGGCNAPSTTVSVKGWLIRLEPTKAA